MNAATTSTSSPSPTSGSNPIRERFALGNQWPTLDPFLFVAHHRDAYPAGTEAMGPDASLDGREMGSDFADVDGWNIWCSPPC